MQCLGKPGIYLLLLPLFLGTAWSALLGQGHDQPAIIYQKDCNLELFQFETKTSHFFPLLRRGNILGGASSELGEHKSFQTLFFKKRIIL